MGDLRDLDSDNDSIPDVEEAGYTDANGDAIIDNFTDLNGNGRDDTVESLNYGPLDFDNNGCIDFEDLDGDGIPDIIDSFVGFGTSSWQQVSSAYVNLDSDSDGIFDIEEIRIDLVVSNIDANGDGMIDSRVDSDGDGIMDIVDLQIPVFGGILTVFDPNQFPSSVSPTVQPSSGASPNPVPSNNAQPSSGSGASITPGPVPTSNSPVPLSASATPSRTPDASTQIVGSTPDSAEIVVNVICSDTTCTPL